MKIIIPELNKIYCGDALEILKSWPDEFIDLVITSPPYYALRNYQVEGQLGLEKTFDEYKKKLLTIIAEIKRVLSPAGQFWLNLGDIYGGTRWSGSGVGQSINKFKDGYRDINPARGFDKKNYGGLGQKRKNTTNQGRGRGEGDANKCLTMMPERIAMEMIDKQNWILRNRICWAKQVLDFKERKTKGSVMPSSVKDRFNESWEYLYFFTKNKKYYSNLDAVRLLQQTFENRPGGFTRSRELEYDSKRLKDYSPQSKQSGQRFNYRIRDAERKEGQPQFKASEKEIKRYNEVQKDYGKKKLIGNEDKKLGNRWMSGTPNFVKQRDWHKEEFEGYKMGSVDSHRAALRGGLKRFNKVNDPRGNQEGWPGSWRDSLDNQEFRKRWKGQKEVGVSATYIGPTGEDHNLLNNPLGKNLPTCWLIGSEPHNFQKEIGSEIDHFAIFPQALLEIPIKFGCPEKGIILDPFIGSGQTALISRQLGRNYLGIELNPNYIKLVERRLAQQVLLT